MKPAALISSLSLSALLGLSAHTFGLGFRIADQGAEATARGDAFAATADDPSAVYYNPAGITQLQGTELLLGGYAISLKEKVNLNADSAPLRSKFSSINTDLQAIPNFYLTWTPKNSPISLGLGLYTPFGFGLEYPDDTAFRTVDRKGSIQFTTLEPVLAWKICDQLSIAAGPTFSYGKAELDQGVASPGDLFQFRGNGYAFGFTAGLMWKPAKQHQFGLTYHGPQRINFDGHTTLRTNSYEIPTPLGPYTVPGIRSRESANAEFNLPQIITAGYSFRPTDDWNFEFDIDWTDWHSLKDVTLHQSSGDMIIPYNWQSSFLYEFGVTRQLPYDFHISAGYCYSQQSVPNDSFSPAIPDSNRDIFSVGVGQKFKHFNWTFAYQYTVGPTRTINQGTLSDGTYRFASNALTLSLGYNF
jgi:long-chain fatty acid transport protein